MRPVLKTATSIPEHERARSAAPPTSPWTLLGEIPPTSLACLALIVGYAGLAWRPAGRFRCWRNCRSAGKTGATTGGARKGARAADPANARDRLEPVVVNSGTAAQAF